MGNGCTKSCDRCCGKVQDWCRDACGCCPCKCCKTKVVETKIEPTIVREIKKPDIPSGYGYLHAGIRMTDNEYTSPVLEIHTRREASMQMVKDKIAMTQRRALGGIQTERDNADHSVGSTRKEERRKEEADEEVTVIPVESIIAIKYATEMKIDVTEITQLRLKTPPPPVHLTCCEKIKNWCDKAFCCCCDDSKTKVHNSSPPQYIKTIANQEAERKILMTIEYIRYNNIHTPTHVNVLATSDRTDFYKEKFGTVTLEFYLINSNDFERHNYELIQMQASTVCRLVTQLKAMAGHYPDERTLEQIIGKSAMFLFGNFTKEI